MPFLPETQLLPESYAVLEPFVADWAPDTAAGRATKRSNSTAEERQAFYDAVQPIAAGALTELDKKPLAELDDKERRLLDLLMCFGHVSLAVEVQGDAEPQHRLWRDCMVITRAPAALPA